MSIVSIAGRIRVVSISGVNRGMTGMIRTGVVLAVFILAFLSHQAPAFGLHSLPPARFDKDQVVLKFAVLSDTHIQWPGSVPSRKLAVALQQVKAKADGKLDALLICGDLTDYGLPEQVSNLKQIIDSSGIDLHETRFIMALGNHEYYNHQLKGAPWNGGYLFRNVFGDEAYHGATHDEIEAGNYHTVVDGYDFIAVNCSRYDGGVKYAAGDIRWLKAQLAEAASKRPGKPIFVASHPMITGTCLGSNEGPYWDGRDLYAVFKSYPQVIYFCGHLHFPENDERSIWQGDFTAISVGSTYYCSNHPTDDGDGNKFIDVGNGFETPDCMKTSQGLFVEVDRNSDVEITRMDFANKEGIKSSWLIPAPAKDRSQLLYYTPAEEKVRYGSDAPVFPAGAKISGVFKTSDGGRTYVLHFTQATDKDMVYSYRVSFVDKRSGRTLKTISTLSDFYLHANPDEMASSLTKTIDHADSVLAPFNPDFSGGYYIRIVALNCFGVKSKPLTSGVMSAMKKSVEQNGDPDKSSSLKRSSKDSYCGMRANSPARSLECEAR